MLAGTRLVGRLSDRPPYAGTDLNADVNWLNTVIGNVNTYIYIYIYIHIHMHT